MISKSMIATMMLVAMGLASPAFAQVPPGYYDYAPGYYPGYAPGNAGPSVYSYEQPRHFRLGTLQLWRWLATRKRR
jgi:hypothetical protein